MALPPADCETPADLCCTEWYDSASLILAHIAERMEACFGDTCNSSPVVFRLGWAAPAIPTCDTFDLWFDSIAPSPGSLGSGGVQRPIILRQMTFQYRLSESGYPTINSTSLPLAAEVARVTPILVSHGEALWRAINSATTALEGCQGVRISSHRATLPEAGCAGWAGSFTITGGRPAQAP